ncbi:MAG: putative ATP-grasp superfamily ATP-dependent carboligase [Candidatus Poriferisodalaceae bacterium]
MTLHRLLSEPSATDATLLLAFEGFGDAGDVQSAAVAALTNHLDFADVASFDIDALIDFRVRRPVMKIRGGHIAKFTWPAIELRHARTKDGHDVFLLDGPEPDRSWMAFIAEVLDLALRFDVKMIVGLASFPGPVPHTRATEIATTSVDAELAAAVPYLPSEIEVPSSIHGAFEISAADRGIAAVGLWAPVPQYASNQPYPGAAAALLGKLGDLTDIHVDLQRLADGGAAAQQRIEDAIGESPEHQRLVRALEEHIEAMQSAQAEDLPSGDDLAADFEKFLDGQDLGGQE